MREILFRGQTRRKGERFWMDGSPVESNWVYGGVLCGSGDHSIIYQTEPDIEKKVVYTDTLGQYTGLTDKNGVKIFEGDIVSLGDANYPVIFNTLGRCAEFALTDGVPFGFDYIHVPMEVVGNIYDNPELIGGEQNEW